MYSAPQYITQYDIIIDWQSIKSDKATCYLIIVDTNSIDFFDIHHGKAFDQVTCHINAFIKCLLLIYECLPQIQLVINLLY